MFEAGRLLGRIFASFIPTAKNAPASSYLADHGFAVAEGHAWRIAIHDVPGVPNYIKLTVPTREAEIAIGGKLRKVGDGLGI